jgi:hypothetical protein
VDRFGAGVLSGGIDADGAKLVGPGEARVAYSTQRSQRDAEAAEKVFDGPAGLVC